jgi:aminoglycoside phosphotransferase family enzyme/gluconate kinase
MNSSSLLIQSLQNPAIYPHTVEYFRVIETHISWVLLTGLYAYKIKKPLNLGFLDFSTLEKRRHYCFEELRLNSRLAKDIYLEVVFISGSEHHPQLTDSGTAIEYAVKMRQFKPEKTFDQLLIQKQLTTEHIKQTATIIATFHTNIKSVTANTDVGNADKVIQPVQENFSQIMQLDSIEKSVILNQLKLWCEQQHTKLAPFFTQRKKSGFIRECHGDLHLGNIALIAHEVVPFDGIEFNPSLYWIDVISEIAFLVMDLQEKKRQDLAFQFLNTYLQHSGDYAGLKLLRFYLVYRAMVRAKVNAIRASQSTTEKEHRQAILSFQDYLQLANSYTQATKPLMIIMHGVSGSGKSWLSEQMITRYQVIRLRSDVERKRLHNLSPQQKSHSSLKSGLYNRASSEKTYQHLLQLSARVIQADYSVIVDATFLQQHQRTLFSQQAKQLQIPFLIVHTHADKQTLLQRIKSRTQRKDNVSEADQAVLENQLQTMQLLTHEELKYSITIDARKNTNLSSLWQLIDQLSL